MPRSARAVSIVSALGRRNEKLSERLARAILDDITARRLRPGARLPAEAAMMEAYGVARTTVREALRILEVNGLIALRTGPGGGPVVAEVSPAEFGRVTTLHLEAMEMTTAELIDVRKTFEPLIARLAAEASENPARRSLARALRSRTVDLRGEPFHRLIMDVPDHRVMSHWALTMGFVVDVHALADPEGIDDERHVGAHREVARAILDGDGDAAEEAMAAHFDDLTAAISAQPGLIDSPVVWE